MSILLDALKHSENQRDLGRVPTLQTSIEPGGQAQRHIPSWVPVLMLLVAAGTITWMGLGQFRLPDGWAESRLAAQSAAGESSQPDPKPANAQPAQTTNGETPAGTSILPKLPATAATPAQSPPQGGSARGVRDYTAPEVPVAVSQVPAEPTRDNAVRQTEMGRVELARENQPAVDSPPEGRAQQDYEPEVISYWQVPEKMREGLPELRISVLVFAEVPENRFVLINGERLREGQEMPNGLLLEEIRRDRAIFKYRNYRFYLKS